VRSVREGDLLPRRGEELPQAVLGEAFVPRECNLVDGQVVASVEAPIPLVGGDKRIAAIRVEGVMKDVAVDDGSPGSGPMSAEEIVSAFREAGQGSVVRAVGVSAWEAFWGKGDWREDAGIGYGLKHMTTMMQEGQSMDVLFGQPAAEGDERSTLLNGFREAVPLLEFEPLSITMTFRNDGGKGVRTVALPVPAKSSVSFAEVVNEMEGKAATDMIMGGIVSIVQEKERNRQGASTRQEGRSGRPRIIEAEFKERA
jgi:hypothetical protein